ncbi:hypothetical protein HPB51_024565 [Rhipicephalus microplus]|uniref:Uncharacterized protein n=1 Tax=Rhipicephalus microplus TaxID=6941 RepID=A0A9J6DK18_RHIMP|nr:hypothetical protein HPB51_024565 [Rhipicephalus microplus]
MVVTRRSCRCLKSAGSRRDSLPPRCFPVAPVAWLDASSDGAGGETVGVYCAEAVRPTSTVHAPTCRHRRGVHERRKKGRNKKMRSIALSQGCGCKPHWYLLGTHKLHLSQPADGVHCKIHLAAQVQRDASLNYRQCATTDVHVGQGRSASMLRYLNPQVFVATDDGEVYASTAKSYDFVNRRDDERLAETSSLTGENLCVATGTQFVSRELRPLVFLVGRDYAGLRGGTSSQFGDLDVTRKGSMTKLNASVRKALAAAPVSLNRLSRTMLALMATLLQIRQATKLWNTLRTPAAVIVVDDYGAARDLCSDLITAFAVKHYFEGNLENTYRV